MEDGENKSKYLWSLMQIRPNICRVLMSEYLYWDGHDLEFGL